MQNKTSASTASPDAYIAAIADESRRRDCAALMGLMARATKRSPVMWGNAIVGFGVHRYALAGGRSAEICSIGFSSRKSDIAIYGATRADGAEELLAAMGRHKKGKGCLYIRRLADIDQNVLEKLFVKAFEAGPA